LTLAQFRCWHDRKKKPVFCEVDQLGYWFPFYLELHGLQISRQYPVVPVIPSLPGIPGRPGKPLCPVNPREPISPVMSGKMAALHRLICHLVQVDRHLRGFLFQRGLSSRLAIPIILGCLVRPYILVGQLNILQLLLHAIFPISRQTNVGHTISFKCQRLDFDVAPFRRRFQIICKCNVFRSGSILA
jgi:hypothetical protein